MIPSNATLDFTTALLIGLLIGSFVEYAVHRLMHNRCQLLGPPLRHLPDRRLATRTPGSGLPAAGVHQYPVALKKGLGLEA